MNWIGTRELKHLYELKVHGVFKIDPLCTKKKPCCLMVLELGQDSRCRLQVVGQAGYWHCLFPDHWPVQSQKRHKCLSNILGFIS